MAKKHKTLKEALQLLFSETSFMENGCVVPLKIWTDSKGYPRLRYKGKMRTASRIVLFGEDINTSMHALHKCDNTKCINKDHLFAGTHADNMQDKITKGRQAGGSLPGKENPSAKLSEEDIIEIKILRISGMSFRGISLEKGISKGHAHRVCSGKVWGNLWKTS